MLYINPSLHIFPIGNLFVIKQIFEDIDNPVSRDVKNAVNLYVLWKSTPAEIDFEVSAYAITGMSRVFSSQIPHKTPQKSINRLSVLEQKVHLRRCTFCQKIGGCRVMKNHTIVQLDWVPHLQHSHKVTHTFLKTLWRHGALQHLLNSWPLKLALWSERLGKEP